tara:strand:+ start:1277 stop:1549 length:273 start_codon:yes stop_codon:yes gene_type:complete
MKLTKEKQTEFHQRSKELAIRAAKYHRENPDSKHTIVLIDSLPWYIEVSIKGTIMSPGETESIELPALPPEELEVRIFKEVERRIAEIDA